MGPAAGIWPERSKTTPVALTRLLRGRAAVAASLVVSALTVGTAYAGTAAPPVPATPMATVAVTDCPADGALVPADYFGFSIEWSMVAHWFGTSADGAVQPTAALLRSLQTSPENAGILRIGGNSQDGYVWRPDGSVTGNKLFEGVINRGMIDALFTVAEQAGWKVVLGLNLRRNSPADAVGLTRYAMGRDTTHRLVGVELGNEPTVYFGSDSTSYISRIYSYVRALDADPVTRLVPIVGPSLANRADLGFMTSMRQSYGSRLPFLAWHHYANRPTLTGLLSDAVSKEWTDRIAQVTQVAGGYPTRMDEGNSVGTGGLNKVSNVMGSSAWLVDTMLTGAAAGISGYHAHAWDGYYYPREHRESYYTPFVVRGGLVYPRPEFYALALLREMPGKRFCNAVTAVGSADTVKSWTLIDPSTKSLLIYAVNKDAADKAGDVTVATPLDYTGTASVSRITDPDGCSGRKTDIDGARLPGEGAYSWPTEPLSPVAASTYTIHLGPCQSALVQIPVSPATAR
jgi:hypothetical protein